MIKSLDINITPDYIYDNAYIHGLVSKKLKLSAHSIRHIEIKKRSLDARKSPVFRLKVDVYVNEEYKTPKKYIDTFKKGAKEKAIIIGAGPAGYFAALKLIELGIRPIILDRGKNVRERRRDLKAIQQDGVVNSDSNYCFGEGGAGTYSDGKLYTRSHKRGNIKEILALLVEHGANPDILIDAHPHIGSNKLPQVIKRIRETIQAFGGEVHFDTKVVDIEIKDGKILGAIDQHGKQYNAKAFVFATGHSARDIFDLFEAKGLLLEKKPFALGVRIEHPQPLIDSIQYKQKKRHENLPASSYSMACQVNNVGVFSFCMCPGGLVVPAATEPGEIVVNGMSLSKRDSPFANSGFVTAVSNEEIEALGYEGTMSNVDFQSDIERMMFENGDGSQKAPALRMTDFVQGNISSDLNSTSYIPGVYAAPLFELFPPFIYERLRQAMLTFGGRAKGYLTSEANVIGVESRTSSPIRIPRNKETLMHQDVEGVFPCGEGAGYAGGILSAAMDGQRVANAIHRYYNA